MSRNDKNKKFAPLNINNVFKGKAVEPQNKPSYKLAGMQNIGKVSSMRRVPPPKWVPSIKAETGVSDGRQIISQATSGWVNPVSSQDNGDPNVKSHGITSKIGSDKSQWTSKISANKPFFLIGQEFPSLHSDIAHDTQDFNSPKDKSKDNENSKSKLEDLRVRDTNISVSTLNRIDALSTSKSSKGDIAATGWAAEDEEPNFDEKIVFSDEESSNEMQNWHSDNEDGSKSERCDKREPIDIPPIISDVWHDQNPSIVNRYPQYSPLQIPVNPHGTYIGSQFQQNILTRNTPCTLTGISDEQAVFMNTVAEQRNARNMEYICAIERARQKKLATQSSRGSCGLNEDHNQMDPSLMRSRNTSMTSDTTESMNTPIEMGPPGGPPLIHIHKPHLQPQLVPTPVPSPMMHNISLIPSSMSPASMIRYTQQSYNIVPLSSMPIDQSESKLMEKFFEFLQLQSTNMDIKPDNIAASTVSSGPPIMDQLAHLSTTNIPEADMKTLSDPCSNDTDRSQSQSHLSSINFPSAGQNVEKDISASNEKTMITKDNKDNSENADRDSLRKMKPKYLNEDDNNKYDQSKKLKKPYNKEYRSNKSVYKTDYSGNSGDRDYYENDDLAYEDYNTYKQHYSRDYKSSNRSYNRNNPNYSYYPVESYYPHSRDNFSTNDYHYKSNSLKLKSKSKDVKMTGSITEHNSSERDPQSSKKFASDNPESWSYDNDITDGSDKKNKDGKRIGKTTKSTYQTKKFDNRSYKDKPNEPTQEFSMGFEVNPKESRKNYTSGNYRRYYADYGKYYSSGSKYNDYDNSYYQEYDYSQEYYYEKDVNSYSSSKYSSKRNVKNSSSDSWRTGGKDDKYSSRNTTDTGSASGGQSKLNNRNNNRKSDKRQFSTKDSNNDNDQEEWETASEGGSVRSSSAPRDLHKPHNRQSNSQINNNDSNNKVIQSSSENRKAPVNKSGSSYSCNGGNNSMNDNNGNQDGSSGAPGSAGGARFLSSNGRSNVSQNRSADSSQSKNMDKTSNNDGRNSDSKSCSNNNNSNKENSNFNKSDLLASETYRTSAENINSSASLNIDKFSDEDYYENSESHFQEVLSKATRKSRKLEEQKRIKEEFRLEQKRQEAQKFKMKQESNQAKKMITKKEQIHRTVKTENNIAHKYENKPGSNNTREKEASSNNTGKKWESNKVSLQIGSWDNSLADQISSEKKAPQKPIGTPASSVWYKKPKNSFESNTTNNVCQSSISNESIKLPSDIEAISQPFIVSSENNDVNFNTTMSYSYNNSIYNQPVRSSEEKKIEVPIETQPSEITIHDTITFEYDVKNIGCDKNHRNLLSNDRSVQNNDQKLLNDKINSVKTIWDNQPTSNMAVESKATTSSSINQEMDIHTVAVSINQDTSNTRNIENNLVNPSVPIPNVCKVKPQQQQDFRKDHNEIVFNSQPFQFRNSPATFLSQNHQGSFMPYNRFPDIYSDTLHASDAFTASLISNNQSGMHINYNLPNTHIIEPSLLRQNTQEPMLSNKVNFLNQTQSSFYPQPATTPKLMSNTSAQLPINMDMGSAHAPPHHIPQLLLTRQNSITSIMQPQNPMTIPFIQSGQQPIQAQTPLFPTTPLLGATNFSSQLNPFSQGHITHYPHGNFPSLHPHTPQFQPNQQMLLNQHPHHQQQQLIQSSLSHDRVLNSGQSGVFNSVIGPSDISTNTGLPDFNGQPKPLNPNNIMHGMSGSAFVLPHNLNILMKPSMFGTNSQYNNFPTPIQSNLLSLKSGFEHNNNLKPIDLDHLKHDNSMGDRSLYCADSAGLQKPSDEYYQDVYENENCDMNYDNWMRYPKLDIYTPSNLMSTFDFHSQKSPIQFSPMEPGNDSAYRNYIAPFRDNHTSLANPNLQYIISPRLKPNFNQDQSIMISRQHSKCYENQNFISTNGFINKNESADNNKMSIKNTSVCNALNSTNEVKENLTKDISSLEKSLSENKKNSKQRTSYSDNFDEKNQSWSLIEDDRSVPLEDNRSSLKSSNTETSSHSPNKHFTNNRSTNSYDNQCQYGYDETKLSSQTAESLGKYDQNQLKKVIMKLREGPVMTDKNCGEFGLLYKGPPIPRLLPYQTRNKQSNKSFNFNSFPLENYGNENVGLGFYSRNRALTPPASQIRTNRNKSNRFQNSSLSNNGTGNSNGNSNTSNNSSGHKNTNSNNSNINSCGGTINNITSKNTGITNGVISNNNNNNSSSNSNSNSNNVINSSNISSNCSSNNGNSTSNSNPNINRVSRQKCDNPSNTDVDTSDLKLNSVQSKSLECDNLVIENIIDNPIL